MPIFFFKVSTMSTVNENIIAVLNGVSIKFSITAKGTGLNRNNWECDGWMLELSHKNNTEYFDYYTGIGHRVVPKFDKAWIMREYKGSVNLKRMFAKYAKPVKPEVCGILHSIALDSEALYTSFSDWCDNFGYDTDSLKALNIYNQCTENAKKMLRIMDKKTLETIKELLKDY